MAPSRLAHLAGDAVGMAQRRAADLALQAGVAHDLGGGMLAEAERGVAGGGAGHRAPAGLRGTRRAAVDEQQLRAGAQLEGQAAGAGGACQLERRRGAGIDEDDGPAALQARIAGADGHLGRGRPSQVVGQHGGERVALGGAHAVEAGERAVAEAQVAQHRRHAGDRREQGRVGRLCARGKALAQGQQVEQQLDEDGRVAADDARRRAGPGAPARLPAASAIAGAAGRGRRCTGRHGRGRSGRGGGDSRRAHCARTPRDR